MKIFKNFAICSIFVNWFAIFLTIRNRHKIWTTYIFLIRNICNIQAANFRKSHMLSWNIGVHAMLYVNSQLPRTMEPIITSVDGSFTNIELLLWPSKTIPLFLYSFFTTFAEIWIVIWVKMLFHHLTKRSIFSFLIFELRQYKVEALKPGSM